MKKAQLTQIPMILSFLLAFLVFAFIGFGFFSWADYGANQYNLTDYNSTQMAKLNITPQVTASFSSMNDIINPSNSTSSGGTNPSQTDLLLSTASSLGRLLFSIPTYISGVLDVALGFNIPPVAIAFALFVVVAIIIAIFLQIVIGR